jgi:hypothetical protein
MARNKGTGKEQKTILVNSVWDASYLLYSNMPFLETELFNGKVIFVFPDTSEVQGLLQEFSRNPQVNIQEFISVFQRVKNLIYQARGREYDRAKGMGKIAQENTG